MAFPLGTSLVGLDTRLIGRAPTMSKRRLDSTNRLSWIDQVPMGFNLTATLEPCLYYLTVAHLPPETPLLNGFDPDGVFLIPKLHQVIRHYIYPSISIHAV